LHCLLTTNGQLNDTRGYHIKPTNYTGNMISCIHLNGPCCQILIIVEMLSKKYILINIKTKMCTPKSRFALGVCISTLQICNYCLLLDDYETDHSNTMICRYTSAIFTKYKYQILSRKSIIIAWTIKAVQSF